MTPTGVRFAQLVLVEIAAAAVLGGLAAGGAWTVAGIVAAVVLVVGAALPTRGGWAYQAAAARVGLWRRRRAAAPGLAGVLGEFRVEAVPGGRGAESFAVVRSAETWTVPLVLTLDDVLGDDAGVPVAALRRLLRVEDVTLAEVRLLAVTTPPRVPDGAPASPSSPVDQFAGRYLLLTVDARAITAALAARGGSRPAVEQILRRCVVTAENTLVPLGVGVRRLDEATVAGLFPAWFGPAAPNGRRGGGRRAVETSADVRAAGTWSALVAVRGRGGDVMARAQRLATAAPTPIVATALVLRSGPRGRPGRQDAAPQLVLRASAPDGTATEPVVAALRQAATALDLDVRPVAGDQVPALRLTTPVGTPLRARRLPYRAGTADDEEVPAVPTGVALGRDGNRDAHVPVLLRLLRLSGTRVVVADERGDATPAALLAIRAATSGIPVDVLTERPDSWLPLVGHGPLSRVRAVGDPTPPITGPALSVVDVRDPVDTHSGSRAGRTADVRPWQCRLEIRLGTPIDAAAATRADLTVLGALSPSAAEAVRRAFGLSAAEEAVLRNRPPGSYAVVRPSGTGPGTLRVVVLDPTEAEARLLQLARTPLAASGPR